MKLRRAVALLAVGVVASLGVTTATQAAPTAASRGPAYTLVDLGTLGGPYSGEAVVWDPVTGRRLLRALSDGFVSVAQMNNAGEVAGTEILPNGTVHALRWDRRGHPQDLGPGTATAINSSGQVAGEV